MNNPTDQVIDLLQKSGVLLTNGLTEREFSKIEEQFQIKFPPDLREFLSLALPISEGFVQWRQSLHSKKAADQIRLRLDWPLDGMLFDVENNAFWHASWGKRPENLEESFAIARKQYANYPQLIPIYSHRYLPSRPETANNPVFSVYQMDIIYYGYNLPHYLATEFKFELPKEIEVPVPPLKKIEFWSEVTEGSAFSEWPV